MSISMKSSKSSQILSILKTASQKDRFNNRSKLIALMLLSLQSQQLLCTTNSNQEKRTPNTKLSMLSCSKQCANNAILWIKNHKKLLLKATCATLATGGVGYLIYYLKTQAISQKNQATQSELPRSEEVRTEPTLAENNQSLPHTREAQPILPEQDLLSTDPRNTNPSELPGQNTSTAHTSDSKKPPAPSKQPSRWFRVADIIFKIYDNAIIAFDELNSPL